MGMTRSVKFPVAPPEWPAVRDLLKTRGHELQICMIDGQLAFPDEEPQTPWNELRFRSPHGMVTVRKTGDRLEFVTWGNADAHLQGQCRLLATAFADAGGGCAIEDS